MQEASGAIRRERINFLGISFKQLHRQLLGVANGLWYKKIRMQGTEYQNESHWILWLASCLSRRWHAEPQRKQCTHVSDILQAFKQWDEMQQVVVCWVANPAFDGNCIVYFRTSAQCCLRRIQSGRQISPGWKT